MARDSLYDPVVQVHVRDVRGGHGAVGDREVVVLAGDLDLARGQPPYRMVAAVVAEGQFVGLAAHSAGEKLVTQADAEHRHLAEQPAQVHIDRLRVARAVGKENAVRVPCQHSSGAGRGRYHVDGCELAEFFEYVSLEPEVIGDDPQRPVAAPVGFTGGDLRHQVDARGARFGSGRRQQRGLVLRWTERAAHGPRVPEVPDQAAGVDARQHWSAVARQPGWEAFRRSPVAWPLGHVPRDDPPAARVVTLVIVRRYAVVTDVRVGEADYLTRVGRIGDYFLIAAEHGVEHHFTGRDGRGRHAAFEDRAVGEYEHAVHVITSCQPVAHRVRAR